MESQESIEEIKKESEYLDTLKIDVGENIPAEVDVYVLKTSEGKTETQPDPFRKTSFEGLPQHLKRKAKRLQKKIDEDSGAKSKARPPEFITAYDILQVVAPPYNLKDLSQLYEANSAHNAAVTMKAINIVGLGYEWIENPRTQFEMEDVQRKNDEDFQKLIRKLKREKIQLNEKLENLNPDEEFGEIMIKIWTDVESLGNGYLEIGRNRNNSIGYLGHIPGHTLRVRATRDGFIQVVADKYVFFRNYGDFEIDNPLKDDPNPNELIHFKKYSPNSTYYGIPDIIPALKATLGDRYAREYNIDYFENKAVPRYAFILKGAKLSAKAEETLINYFKNEIKGKHHGTLYIPLPASIGQQVDAQFQALEVGIQGASFLDYIRENRQEILMAHRVPPGKVGVFNNMNLAISRDADKTFKEQVCRPEQRRAEKKINKIFKEFTETHILKFIESDVIDADIKSRIHDRYARIQAMVPNEIRREIGLPTRPDGNEPLPFTARGEGPGQRTSEGAKPKTPIRPDQTGQRRQRGEQQDEGRPPEQ